MAFFESDQWQPWLPQYAVGSLTFPQAVQMGFLLLDAQIRQDPDLMTAGGVVLGGTTTCAVWVADKYLFSGNMGDSRLVLSYNGRAFPVTSDHKPANQLEAARIERMYEKMRGSTGSLPSRAPLETIASRCAQGHRRGVGLQDQPGGRRLYH